MRQPWPAVLAVSVFLGACASAPNRGAPSTYSFDTISNNCRTNPANCAAMAGDRAALHPLATAGATINAALRVLDAAMKASIEKVLAECAGEARSEVLLRRLGGRSPTAEECLQQIGVDARGEPVTRAMKLGEEMHEVARQCAEKKLNELRPGGFSLEQRYRYDSETGQTSLVSRAEEEALLRRGHGRELLGTLKPDVVIHAGDPLRAQAIYDFKFPCVNSDKIPPWRKYPPGHPYEGASQAAMYEAALAVTEIWRVLPRLGVVR
jgi:hypothetical protein